MREASSEEKQCGVKKRRAVVSMPGLSGTAPKVRPDAGGRSCRLGETALAGAGETAVPVSTGRGNLRRALESSASERADRVDGLGNAAGAEMMEVQRWRAAGSGKTRREIERQEAGAQAGGSGCPKSVTDMDTEREGGGDEAASSERRRCRRVES